MKTLLLALSLCGLCHADTIFQVKYIESDNDGFTMLYDLDHPPTLDVVNGQDSYGGFESVIVNGASIPTSSMGGNPGQLGASAFIILGAGESLVQFFLTDIDTGQTINDYGGVTFPGVRNLNIPEGETVTFTGNQPLPPDGTAFGIATLTLTNVAPEPLSSGLVVGSLLGLLAWGSKRSSSAPPEPVTFCNSFKSS